MNYKVGKCIDCAPDAPAKPLIAKRCEFHYKIHRNKVNAGKKHNVEKKAFKKDLNVYFASQILQIPATCENCGCDIRWQREKHPRALVAHILPKRKQGGFPAVATHPKNRVFLCITCHTDFDNKGAEYAENMRCLPIMRQRFEEFKNCLTAHDLERVPNYLKKCIE